eukprot:363966-Chlamydomonas_euryale.AAC.2
MARIASFVINRLRSQTQLSNPACSPTTILLPTKPACSCITAARPRAPAWRLHPGDFPAHPPRVLCPSSKIRDQRQGACPQNALRHSEIALRHSQIALRHGEIATRHGEVAQSDSEIAFGMQADRHIYAAPARPRGAHLLLQARDLQAMRLVGARNAVLVVLCLVLHLLGAAEPAQGGNDCKGGGAGMGRLARWLRTQGGMGPTPSRASSATRPPALPALPTDCAPRKLCNTASALLALPTDFAPRKLCNTPSALLVLPTNFAPPQALQHALGAAGTGANCATWHRPLPPLPPSHEASNRSRTRCVQRPAACLRLPSACA